MLCPLFMTYAVAALLSAGEPATPTGHAPLTAPLDSSAEAAVIDEIRAFYRDLDGGNWAALLTHFLPAKVTARWAPPTASDAWANLSVPPPTSDGAASTSDRCAPRTAVTIVGAWARVRVRRCDTPIDEAWLLHVSDRWKIVHLVLGTPTALSTRE